MKIALLNIYNGVVNRGAETFVKEMSQRLSRNNKVTVFQAGSRQGFEKYQVKKIDINFNWDRKGGVGTIRSLFFLDYWNRLIFFFTLKCIPTIVKEKYDIVVPVNGGWMPAILRIATWFYGGKMVISGQSGMGWDDRNNLWCFPNTFVALSNKANKWAKKANPFVKTVYIPNGVDTTKFSTKGKVYEIGLKKPVILCVAALTLTKRVDLTIKAASKINGVSLLIVGDGDLKEELTELGNKLLPGRFKMIKLPFEAMPSVYRACDVFTVPSMSYYAFEIVLVEAMASGLPVVANDDEIRREIVGDAGVLVDPEDISAYADTLRLVIKSKWGDRPQKQAKKFAWDRVIEKYEQLFNNLVNRKK